MWDGAKAAKQLNQRVTASLAKYVSLFHYDCN